MFPSRNFQYSIRDAEVKFQTPYGTYSTETFNTLLEMPPFLGSDRTGHTFLTFNTLLEMLHIQARRPRTERVLSLCLSILY